MNTEVEAPTNEPLAVVAVAASAGGLEATSVLAQSLPNKQNCCYIIAQHMSPTHKSMLVQLLSRVTSLEVAELEDGTVPEANIIYIPPPGSDVVYEDGKLVLLEPAGHPASPKPSADRLFASLARALGRASIGVVLSGTGSDGSYGVQEIREQGGITIAQDPATCKYDGMPNSAIETGCVDLTLTPQQIGEHIGIILSSPRDLDALRDLNEESQRTRDLFDILLKKTDVDFRQYKESTVSRRIQRRMVAKGISDFDTYVEFCRDSPEEAQALYSDLLISVTRFFREPDQFQVLANSLKSKFNDTERSEPVRVWVAGCATGEEAYSIAILLVEALGGLAAVEQEDLQIFATDIDDNALKVARNGIYPLTALSDIPPEHVDHYFDVIQDRIQVKEKLRRFVMFSKHNVFQDPPFISTDLIALRNVLIYFNNRLQERVLTRMAYALRPDGILFLGTSESLGSMERSFAQVAPNARVFKKRDIKQMNLREYAAYPTLFEFSQQAKSYSEVRNAALEQWRYFDMLAEAVITDGVLVSRDHAVLRVYGDLAPYASLTANSFGQGTLSILRKSLATDAASLSLVALKNKEIRTGQMHDLPGEPDKAIQVTAYPILANKDSDSDMVLIGIRTLERPESKPRSGDADAEYVAYLEDELSRLRDALQVTIEQLQTSNEELQSLNEELQSANEELQSTNEELETSNEELQSTNEELITVNEELLVNSSQLERASAELTSLVENTPTQLLMLDQGLVIRYASRAAREAFGLRDRGVGLGHLSQAHLPENYPKLIDLCSQALLDRQPHDEQFQTGMTISNLQIAPVMNSDGGLIGLVVQCQNVDGAAYLPEINRKIKEMNQISTWRINYTSGAVDASEEARAMGGRAESDQPSTFDEAMANLHPDDQDRVRGVLQNAAETLSEFEYLARLRHEEGHYLRIQVVGIAFVDEPSGDIILAGVLRNYTDAVVNDVLVQHYDRVTSQNGLGFYTFDVASDQPYWNKAIFEILDIPPDTPPTVDLALQQFGEDAAQRIGTRLGEALAKGEPYEYVEPLTRKDGTTVYVRGTGNAEIDARGEISRVYGSFEIVDAPTEGGKA